MRGLNIRSFFNGFLVAIGSMGLVACETTDTKNFQRCPLSDTPIEGRIDEYFPCMRAYRKSPHSAFKLSTSASGIDKTDDTNKRVIWPHVEAYAGEHLTDLLTRIHFIVWPFDQKNKITEQPPSKPLSASISGWAEPLPVSYLRRGHDVDLGESWETDYYYIALNPSFIENLIAENPDDDLAYIGEAFTVDIARSDYEDLSFEVNPSEILAAVYAAKTGFACPPDKAPKVKDAYSLKYYYESCLFTATLENNNR